MPLADGNMTEDEFQMVSTKLATLWNANEGRPPCRSCGSIHYYLHPILVGNRSDTIGVLEQHTRLPSVVVYCANCGQAEFHVAWVLGLQPLTPPPPIPPAPPDQYPAKGFGDG